MDIFHVIDFIKLSECGNYSIAADELYITQSSLSKHIQSLEKVLGVELFNRTTRKISLSEGGKIFLPYARQLEAVFLRASKDLQHLISEEQLKFTLGCMPTMAFYNIMDVVADFRIQHPEVNINISEFHFNSEKEITESLLNSEFEMVVCDSIFVKPGKFETINYCNDHLIAVLHQSHPLASLKTIELKQLADEPLVFLSKATTTYSFCYKVCEDAGFIPKIYFLGSRIENVLECVSNNMGIALLFEKFTSIIRHKDVVVREIIPTAKRTVVFGRVANHTHSMASKQFWGHASRMAIAQLTH
jgi:DNA-binding transcriptional LysR family regulator